MTQEAWLVISVAAGFFLMGVAASPLGWMALLQRRDRAQREHERGLEDLRQQLRGLQSRLDRYELSIRPKRDDVEIPLTFNGRGPKAPRINSMPAGRPVEREAADVVEPRLIAVPSLASGLDRQAAANGLGQRHAAIWDLADGGASPDVIARATGQPIGQIELILGLRRQVDGTRTNIPHASHE